MDIQLKRGLLDVCVLAAIKDEESYGYRIIRDVKPYIELSESTLYTILKRLETANMLTVRSAEHGGRLRKYYRITAAGLGRIEEFKNEWISSSELKDIYNFSSYWAGEEIWIYKTALFGSDEEDIKYTLTGSPSSKFEKNKTYKCKYKKYTIRVQYDGGFDGGLLFNYEDLCNAGIIEKL